MAKLLYFVTEDSYFVSHRLPVARAARDAGHEVVVATRLDEYRAFLEGEGFRVVPLKTLQRRSQQPVRELATLVELIAIYLRERPDLVHHVAIKPVLYGSIAAKLSRVPSVVNAVPGLGFVFISEDRRVSYLRQAVKLAYRVALSGAQTKTIFQNPDDLGKFVDAGMVRRKQTCLIRGSGVDVEMFQPQRSSSDVPRIVFGARMLWDKGLQELADAADILAERGVRCQIDLYGRPDLENPASATLDELEQINERDLVTWHGHTDSMADVLMSADIACLPSYREGLPKFLLEAAACGLPIVTTDVPGCREICIHGESGYLVQLKSTVELADALQELVVDAELRERMGARGRRLVEEELSVEAVVEQTLDLYDELLASA